MKYRKEKPTDQQKVEEAYQLLLSLIESRQKEIEPALWIGAMISALAENFEKSDIPFDYFKEEMKKVVEHYRY